MWLPINGFSDYMLNSDGQVLRVSTQQMFDKSVVAMKDDRGIWRNRSTRKLLEAYFGKENTIIAKPIRPCEPTMVFSSIKEAAKWLIKTKQAITAGRLAAYQTVRTNISRGISQPDLYPYVYGYAWKKIERSLH